MIAQLTHHIVKLIQQILTSANVFHVLPMMIVQDQRHIVIVVNVLSVTMTLTVQPIRKHLIAL
jgi:hypothetical protein